MTEDEAAALPEAQAATRNGLIDRIRRAMRGGVRSPIAQSLLALAIYTAAWTFFTALPLVLHLTRPQLYPVSPDPNFYVWSMRWWPYALAHGLNPLHPTVIGAPHGYRLAWTNSTPTLALLFAPLTLAVSPVATFNLLVVLSLPLSAWAAFVLCRRLTGRFWPAFAGGAIYGFSAYEMNHITAGQLNLAVSAFFPIMAYLAVRWLQRDLSSRVFVGLLAVAMLAQFLMSVELFADMTAVGVAALVLGVVTATPETRPRVVRLAGLVGVAYIATVIVASPYIAFAFAHVPSRFAHFSQLTSVDLAGTVVPRPGQTLGIGWLARTAARLRLAALDGYMGIPLLGVVAAAAVSMRGRRSTRFLLVLLALVVLGALGPRLRIDGRAVGSLPWGGLWHLPVARSAFPARLMVFAFLILAVVLALWLRGPSKRAWARWAVAGLVLASVGGNAPGLITSSSFTVPPFFTDGTYRRLLAPGDTVLVVPDYGNEGMLWQAQTDMYMRLTGGFVGVGLTPRFGQQRVVSDLAGRRLTPRATRRFRSFLRRTSVAAVLVDVRHPGRWPAILPKLGYRGRATGGLIFYRI